MSDERFRVRRDVVECVIGKCSEGKFKVGIFGEDVGLGNGLNVCKDCGW